MNDADLVLISTTVAYMIGGAVAFVYILSRSHRPTYREAFWNKTAGDWALYAVLVAAAWPVFLFSAALTLVAEFIIAWTRPRKK
jgi:Na+-driven multidrug efflux pump